MVPLWTRNFSSIISLLEKGSLPPKINSTTTILFPKNQNPSSMQYYRPISLCNVIYKNISKTLAYIFKTLLAKCILEEQTKLLSGAGLSLIMFLVASEVVYYMKCKKKGKMGEMAMKIDISKAFDKIK